MENKRYDEGLKKLNEIDGQTGQKVIDSLRSIAPDLARYIIEFPFGDIYQRPGLDLRTRELVTVAALTALGHCQPQLKVHVNGALNVVRACRDRRGDYPDGCLCRFSHLML